MVDLMRREGSIERKLDIGRESRELQHGAHENETALCGMNDWMMNMAGAKDRPEAWGEGPIRVLVMTLQWRLGRVVRSDDELRSMYAKVHGPKVP